MFISNVFFFALLGSIHCINIPQFMTILLFMNMSVIYILGYHKIVMNITVHIF